MAEEKIERLNEALDEVIENCIADELVAAAHVIVYYDGREAYQRAAGYADPLKNRPMQEDSLFRLASVSKAFTSLAAGVLIEQGKLAFDDPVTKWLPYFTPQLPDGSAPAITIRQLLSHQAGLGYGWDQDESGPYKMAGVSDGLDISGITLEENLKRLASVPLFYAPGTSWQYSLAPDVMGAVIEKASGMSFPEAMKALVTDPLGMTDTGFYADESDRERMTAPYFLIDGRLTRMGGDQFVDSEDGRRFLFSPDRAFDRNEYPSGGVGMIGTAPDLIRLVEAIRLRQFPGISEALMVDMCSNHMPVGMFADPGLGFGLGWAVLLDPAAAQTPQLPGTQAWGGVYGLKWFGDLLGRISVVTMTTTAMDEALTTAVKNAVYASLR